jgi:cytochrome P450
VSTISERVARGVAWLDENRPAWDREIDLGRLVLSSPCRCVLGQLYGDYSDAPIDARLDGYDVQRGFNSSGRTYGERDNDFDALEAEWRRVITERRAAA